MITADDKHRLITQAIKVNALKFGTFTLKSGRISPYFFNLGAFSDGESFNLLGELYAKAIINAKLPFEHLFGPAYKGLPLATAAAMHLEQSFQQNIPVSFNRKEAKTHGEGGQLIGAPLKGNVLILDDVITAGTAFMEAKSMIEAEGAKVSGLIIALDREEVMHDKCSAVESIKQKFDIPVISLISLSDVITYTKDNLDKSLLDKLQHYRAEYSLANNS